MADQVKGLDKLLRQLKAIPDAVRAELSKSLEDGAAEMAGAIRRAASFDPKLARTVDYRAGPAPGSAILKSSDNDSDRVRIKGEAGLFYTVFAGDSEAFWARWTEYGTAPHSLIKGADISRGKRQIGAVEHGAWHPGARANPFFWPTVRLYKKRLKGRVIRAGRKAAKRAAGVG